MEGMTRRELLKQSIVGGVAIGTGLGHVHLAHAQTNLRFSTWHVPVGRDVQTVWIPMMEELKKIQRVVARQIPDAPHERIMVLDATSGLNALVQARHFHEAVGLTGLILTKLDGTAKGGVVVAIADQAVTTSSVRSRRCNSSMLRVFPNPLWPNTATSLLYLRANW